MYIKLSGCFPPKASSESLTLSLRDEINFEIGPNNGFQESWAQLTGCQVINERWTQ
jgi:hypothetical protein